MIRALAWLVLAVMLAGPVGLVTIWSLAAVIAGVGQMARRRKEKEKNDGRL